MSVTKIVDIESIRFGAPDLDVMRTFLLDFGLVDLGPQTDGVLRMRGSGSAPALHETEKGEAGFRALTMRAGSLADLEALAAHDGVTVEPTNRPGGGQMVRLTDPNGFLVEVIAGGTLRESDAPPKSAFNWNGETARTAGVKRVGEGPSQVARLGHAVFLVPDLVATWNWWSERFGLLMSDDVRAPDGNMAAIFIRCDRGDSPADHHTLNFASPPGAPAAFHHAAFEVGDVDDLMKGHDVLKAKGYQHSWGVGRHFLGSQIFDYWMDPFGHRVEHWTDGDVFTADAPVNVTDMPTMLGMQWGPPTPAGFV